MTIEQRIDDQFPAGMRVLAVDDDPTCLLLLERLLRRCKYNVTTITHAFAALSLLRENKNKFDLVISDVHMPDMDGFKLLELVGLEMDLPVIMLSAYGDTKLVMKGVTHGACDYLLKPVRIEELQNIWQHVIRKKKVDSKDQKVSDDSLNRGAAGNGNAEQKSNKKRKDQVQDDDEDHDENGTENVDPSAQKRSRVVWSVELHRKFVAAVNHLGVGNAVPKRILELMNVDNLTRENVASHLQKYKLCLRRISNVQSQKENMVAAFGNTDPSYMRISALDGMGGFDALSGSPHFQNAAFRSFQPNVMIGRLNSPGPLGIQRFPSPIPVDNSQFSGFTLHAADQGSTLIHGNPNEFGQLQDNNDRSVSHIGEVHTKVSDPTAFPVYSFTPEAKRVVGSSNSSRLTALNNTLMLKGHPVQAHSRFQIGNQSSATLVPLSPDLSSHFSDRSQGSDRWPVTVNSSAVQLNSSTSSSGGHHINTHLDNGPSITELPLSVPDYQYQGSHTSISIGHRMSSPYGQVTNSSMPNAQEILELIASQQPTYVDTTQLQHRESDNSTTSIPYSNLKAQTYQQLQLTENAGYLEDVVSSVMKLPYRKSGT
ncbi:unnamed protein product [Rhodiola kirilowii]